MNCDVCGAVIVRRFFKKAYDDKTLVICPFCNKDWANIKIKLDEQKNIKPEEA